MPKPTPKPAGFSLLELMVAVSIMLVVAAAAFSLLIAYQNYYQSTVLRADMHSGLRTATMLLEQEIGQAGLVSLTATCSPALPFTTTGCPTVCPSGSSCAGTGITSSTTAQTVPVSSTTGMFVGELLEIDLGTAHETAAITAIGSSPATITAVFAKSHNAGAIVRVEGIFPQGVLSSSTGTQLNMFGDINGDGTLVFVQYNCSTATGTLTRSVTPLTASAKNTAATLLDNLTANPGNTACFQYSTTSVTSGTTYNFTVAVGVTLTTQTTEVDPVTKAFTQETKSFLNLAPRNIVMGVALANAGLTQNLQPNPPSCLLQLTC